MFEMFIVDSNQRPTRRHSRFLIAQTRLLWEVCNRVGSKRGRIPKRVKHYWEIISDNLSKAGFSLGWVSAIDSEGRTIWIADAHRCDGKRFVVRADEKLTAFLELEAAYPDAVKCRTIGLCSVG